MNARPRPSLGVSSPAARAPLVLEEQGRDRREPGTADHHQVGRPPQRHVLAEDAVPDVVEGKADQGVQAAAGHQEAADRRVPVAGDPYCERTRLLVGQHDRRAAGDEQQEQAHQDEVVRRVGQRPGSRPLPMCRLTSQMKPNSAQMIVAMNSASGTATHGGRLNLRPAHSANAVDPGDLPRPVQVTEPHSSAPMISATTVMPITWPIAAPPPSFAAAMNEISVEPVICPTWCVSEESSYSSVMLPDLPESKPGVSVTRERSEGQPGGDPLDLLSASGL